MLMLYTAWERMSEKHGKSVHSQGEPPIGTKGSTDLFQAPKGKRRFSKISYMVHALYI